MQIPVAPGDSLGYDGYGLLVLHHLSSSVIASTGRITGEQILDQVIPQEQEKARQTGQMIAAMNGNVGAGSVNQFAGVVHSIQNTIPNYVLDELKRSDPGRREERAQNTQSIRLRLGHDENHRRRGPDRTDDA